jgi:hypothetical protein
MQSEGIQRLVDREWLPEILLVLMILTVSPIAAMSAGSSFTILGLTALVLALPFIYVATVMKVFEDPDMFEKKRLFKIYMAFFLVMILIIVAYEFYRSNWPSTIGNVIGRMADRMYLVFAGIQSICIVIVNLFVKRQATNPKDKRSRLRLWMSVLMVLVSPLNLLLYVLLFFQGT